MKNKQIHTFIGKIMVLICTLYLNSAFGATIKVVDVPSFYPVSSDFQLEMIGDDGIAVAVPVTDFVIYGNIQAHYARVDFEGTVTVKVTADENINSHEIRPLRHNFSTAVSGKTLQHTLLKPEYLAYYINDKQILFLLAVPLETDIPNLASPLVKNIMDYVVDATGNQDSTQKIIQAMIDAEQSGNTLYFPAGIYKLKQLILKDVDGLDVYMAPGAVIKGTGDGKDFNQWSSSLQAGDKKIDHFIHILDSKNVSFSGRGTVDAQGTKVHLSLNNGEPIHNIGDSTMKIRGITVEDSDNINFDGLLIQEAGSQSLPSKGCNFVTISNSLTMNYLHLKNSGGFNFWGCRDSKVINSFYYGGDDGLSAKATSGDGDVYNLLFENNVIYTLTRGITFGMQGEEDMYDVVFRNIDIISTRDGIDLKHNYGNGHWHDILIENVTVDEIIKNEVNGELGDPINFQIKQGGKISKVVVKNVTIKDCGIDGDLNGDIVDITFENVTVCGRKWHDLASSQLVLSSQVKQDTIDFFWNETGTNPAPLDSDRINKPNAKKDATNSGSFDLFLLLVLTCFYCKRRRQLH
ncbi:MAG: hypothetical protein HRT54_19955 [Colwellia sp.]|nr:hypothetical protein [Colwellia sp.]